MCREWPSRFSPMGAALLGVTIFQFPAGLPGGGSQETEAGVPLGSAGWLPLRAFPASVTVPASGTALLPLTEQVLRGSRSMQRPASDSMTPSPLPRPIPPAWGL